MFSAAHVAALAQELLPCRAELLQGGLGGPNRARLLRHLLRGRPLLVPYDGDSNHARAAAAATEPTGPLLIGLLVAVPPQEPLGPRFQRDPEIPNVFHAREFGAGGFQNGAGGFQIRFLESLLEEGSAFGEGAQCQEGLRGLGQGSCFGSGGSQFGSGGSQFESGGSQLEERLRDLSLGSQFESGVPNRKSNPKLGLGSPIGAGEPELGLGSPIESGDPKLGLGSPLGPGDPELGLGSPLGPNEPELGLGSPIESEVPKGPELGLGSPIESGEPELGLGSPVESGVPKGPELGLGSPSGPGDPELGLGSPVESGDPELGLGSPCRPGDPELGLGSPSGPRDPELGLGAALVLALQGKSPRPQLWPLGALASSNAQLGELSPRRRGGGFVLPPGGLARALQGRAVLLHPLPTPAQTADPSSQ
uniref:Actin maturation protease n=1 Tax=Geospiza parvula TaxID=87175 RepID=A0A8C3QBW1_GEOPR